MAACWPMRRFSAHAAAIGQMCFSLPTIPFHQEPRRGLFGQVGPAQQPPTLATGADLRIAVSAPQVHGEGRTRRERGDSARIHVGSPWHAGRLRRGLCKDSGGPKRGAETGRTDARFFRNSRRDPRSADPRGPDPDAAGAETPDRQAGAPCIGPPRAGLPGSRHGCNVF